MHREPGQRDLPPNLATAPDRTGHHITPSYRTVLAPTVLIPPDTVALAATSWKLTVYPVENGPKNNANKKYVLMGSFADSKPANKTVSTCVLARECGLACLHTATCQPAACTPPGL